MFVCQHVCVFFFCACKRRACLLRSCINDYSFLFFSKAGMKLCVPSAPALLAVSVLSITGTIYAIEHPVPPASCDAPFSTRASCYTQRWEKPPTGVPSGRGLDGPLAGNGDMGVVLSGGDGIVTLYTGKNDFWGIKDIPGGGCPYTIMSGAWLQLSLPGKLTDDTVADAGGWSGTQDIQNARVNATTSSPSGATLHTSTIIAANSNVMLTQITASITCNITVELTMSLASYEGFPTFPLPLTIGKQAHGVGGTNTHRTLNYVSLLPCDPSAIIWPSVRTVALSASGVLEVTNTTSGSTGCIILRRDNTSIVHEPNASRCDASAYGTAWKPLSTYDGQSRGDDTQGVRLQSLSNALLCLSYTDGTPTQFGSRAVRAVPCASALAWVLERSSGHIVATDRDLYQQPNTTQCLTAAPPNLNNSLYQALSIADAAGTYLPLSECGGVVHHPPALSGPPPTVLSFQVPVVANTTYTLALSSVSMRDAEHSGMHAADLAKKMAHEGVRNATALTLEHTSWWSDYWQHGAAVSLGSERLLLEGWWYGAQYLFGSATRPGKVAPGLWGPWVTGDMRAAWNGDYTIDYSTFAFLVAITAIVCLIYCVSVVVQVCLSVALQYSLIQASGIH